jgi:hypothetical protein
MKRSHGCKKIKATRHKDRRILIPLQCRTVRPCYEDTPGPSQATHRTSYVGQCDNQMKHYRCHDKRNFDRCSHIRKNFLMAKSQLWLRLLSERRKCRLNPFKPELNSICYLLALLGAHHCLHVSRIRVKLLTFRLLLSYIYGAPILDVSRSHTSTQHSR